MPPREAFFARSGESYRPLEPSVSGWSLDQVRGPALTGLLARTAERACRHRDRQPARASFELFRAAHMSPTLARARVVRSGRRLSLVDAELEQDGTVVARAHVLFLTTSREPKGRPWEPGRDPDPPPPGMRGDGEGRIYRSDADWTSNARDHHNSHPKAVWQLGLTVVDGEQPTPFQRVAAASDITSLVTHWSERGVEFINADVSIALSRLPVGPDLGLRVLHRSSDAGISVGAAGLFDRTGRFGSSSVVALANAPHAVMPGDAFRHAAQVADDRRPAAHSSTPTSSTRSTS